MYSAKRISEKINEASRSWKANLLVRGTHGRHGLNRLFLGSVAEEIIRITPIPVLLIRGKEKNQIEERIAILPSISPLLSTY